MSSITYAPPFLFWVAGGSILTSHYGPLSILNPFRHLVAMTEAIRYGVGSLLGVGGAYELFPITTVQGLNAFAGMFGLAGWFVLMLLIFVRYGATDI